MTGRTGYTGLTDLSAMDGAAQITDVYEHFDPLIDASIALIASLPVTGNWVGREFYVEEDGSIRRWTGSAWRIMYKPRTAFAPNFALFTGGNAYADDAGFYSIAGGEVTVEVIRTFAAAGTISVDNITLALPVSSASAGLKSELTPLGDVIFHDASAAPLGRFAGTVVWSNSNTVRMFRPASATAGLLAVTSSAQPFVWAVNDGLYARFRYPAA